MHRMISYTGTCSIMVISLLYRLNVIVKCVCYMGLGFDGCFVTGAALMGSHYMTYIISGVGHLMSNSVVPLVLWIVAYNIQGTGIVLQVSWDNANPAKKR